MRLVDADSYQGDYRHLEVKEVLASMPEAIVKCDIGQIGDVAMQGHRESDLNILAAETFVTE